MARVEGYCVHGQSVTKMPVETYLEGADLEWFKTQPDYPKTGYLVEVAISCKLCDGEVTGVPYKPGPPQVKPDKATVSLT